LKFAGVTCVSVRRMIAEDSPRVVRAPFVEGGCAATKRQTADNAEIAGKLTNPRALRPRVTVSGSLCLIDETLPQNGPGPGPEVGPSVRSEIKVGPLVGTC